MALSTKLMNEVGTILEDLKPIINELPGTAPGFVRDQIERFDTYGASMLLSEKQLNWLRSLHEKHCGTLDSQADTGGREELHPNHPDADRPRGPKKATRRAASDGSDEPHFPAGKPRSDMDDDIPF